MKISKKDKEIAKQLTIKSMSKKQYQEECRKQRNSFGFNSGTRVIPDAKMKQKKECRNSQFKAKLNSGYFD